MNTKTHRFTARTALLLMGLFLSLAVTLSVPRTARAAGVDGVPIVLGSGLPVNATVDWNTTAVANGWYNPRAIFRDGGAHEGSRRRPAMPPRAPPARCGVRTNINRGLTSIP